ncbi:MAG: FAD-linked oxidase C-terminal domain-containing protein [Bacteroidota bacterium]
MTYNSITSEDLDFFKTIVPQHQLITETELLKKYGRDYTEDFVFPPALVLIPDDSSAISKIMAYCHSRHIPVTPRGAGTGLSGGCLPIKGGIVLSLEKLNKIIEIDADNFQAIVEPGVINDHLQTTVQQIGLFYPPDPASKGSCSIGGNVAHSSGGPRCVKYGTTRDYVLNLEVVLPSGDIIQTGANVLKNSTGYNLTQLMVGSEGTLGIVTKITLKLIPYPSYNTLLLASFNSATEACACVPAILNAGIIPSALEFMDKKGLELSVKHHDMAFETGSEKAYLLIEVDGYNADALMPQCEKIYEVLEHYNAMNILLAEDAATKEKFWKIRRSIGEVVKNLSIYKEEDTVVSRKYLPELYDYINYLSTTYGFESVCYGHAGDGNLHVNILKQNMSDEKWQNELPIAIRLLFEKCKALGGTISGEHGIGMVQKPYLDIVFGKAHIEIFKGIKRSFDPHLILNPGKIFDI